VFGILSMNEAKRVGKPNMLAILAFVASAIGLVWNIVAYMTRIRG
jgi:hypothetical protein